MSTNEIQQLATDLQVLVKQIAFKDVTPDQSLISTQILDSIGIVDLVVEIENKYGVTFDLQHVNEAGFDTILMIAQRISEAKKA